MDVKAIEVSVAACWGLTALEEFLYWQFQQYSPFEGATKWEEYFNLSSIVIVLSPAVRLNSMFQLHGS